MSTRAQTDPRPIETSYQGCRFRSRLEARWAVFFDALGIRWEYEPQGYVLDGTPYLPDFELQLPRERFVFAEVKHAGVDSHEGRHVGLCRSLARESGRDVVLLVGPPSLQLYNLFGPGTGPDEFHAAFFLGYDELLRVADSYWFGRAQVDAESGALRFPFDDFAARKSFGDRLVEAIRAARSARFEYGETGRSVSSAAPREWWFQ